MRWLLLALIAIGLIPFALALRANRGTSLTHALGWAIVAWLSWGYAILVSDYERLTLEPARFCALALTGGAGVAVLGARRPYVFAWNFVVIALFPVMAIPLFEMLFIGTTSLDGLRIVFLAGTIAVGVLNYLPTRTGLAALVLLAACLGQIALLFAPALLESIERRWIIDGLIVVVPWIAWMCYARQRTAVSEIDRLWIDFRDRWGVVWSQRVREQFNQAALNAGWAVTLGWNGLTVEENRAIDEAQVLETLRAVLQRFLPERDQ